MINSPKKKKTKWRKYTNTEEELYDYNRYDNAMW